MATPHNLYAVLPQQKTYRKGDISMIKGFKHMKMATIITLSVAVISLLCLSCLYLVMTSSVTRTSKQGSIDNMYTALNGQANMIELFVQESERSLRQYATADELKELLLEPDDAAKQQAAQAYTERFFAHSCQHNLRAKPAL